MSEAHGVVPPHSTILCRAASSSEPDVAGASREIIDRLGWSGPSPDFVLVFAAGAAPGILPKLADDLASGLSATSVLAATSDRVSAGGYTFSRGPSFAVMACSAPNCTSVGFTEADMPGASIERDEAASLYNSLTRGNGDHSFSLVIGSDRGVSAGAVVRAMNAARAAGGPLGPLLGGLASDRTDRGFEAYLNGAAKTSGFVGLALSGEVKADPLVAMGCRPIGPMLVVTDARGHMILGLNGEPAARVVARHLATVHEELPDAIQGRRLFLGQIADDSVTARGRGNTAICAIDAVDEELGAIAVASPTRNERSVRLHLIDDDVARHDLSMLLDVQGVRGEPAGVILSSSSLRFRHEKSVAACDAGRVQRAFHPPLPGSDAAKAGDLVTQMDRVPLAGLGCSCEFGPVGHIDHVHQASASAVFLRSARNGDEA